MLVHIRYLLFFTDDIGKYFNTLFNLGISRKDELKTVWDNLTQVSPGIRMIIEHNGVDIYKMIELLKEKGLYYQKDEKIKV